LLARLEKRKINNNLIIYGKRKDFEIVFIKIKKEKLNRSFSIIGLRRAGKLI
jgi:hypothetical protein